MTKKKILYTNKFMPDLAHLIRCVQRLEGHRDCFGGTSENCQRNDCDWRDYCLEEAKKATDDKHKAMGEGNMSKKNPSQSENTVTVARRKKHLFSVEAPEAKEVLLMGDFNNWDPIADPMKNDGSGVWTKSVALSPGKYEYKFLVDGQWKEDATNKQRCPNCFGTMNNIVELT